MLRRMLSTAGLAVVAADIVIGIARSGRFADGHRLTCVGNGDNDGLTAILIVDWSAGLTKFEGLIFPGEVTPLPELSAE